MTITRRTLLGRLAAGVATGLAVQAMNDLSPAKVRPAPDANSVRTPIDLSGNENAYGPSERVLAAMRASLSGSNRYPGTEYHLLLNKIAAVHRVKPEQIILGCGSSEVLEIAAKAFLGVGKRLVQASPTCSLPGRFAQDLGAEVVNIPLSKNYEHDLNRMLTRTDASRPLTLVTGEEHLVHLAVQLGEFSITGPGSRQE